jgi:hypothetical protein
MNLMSEGVNRRMQKSVVRKMVGMSVLLSRLETCRRGYSDLNLPERALGACPPVPSAERLHLVSLLSGVSPFGSAFSRRPCHILGRNAKPTPVRSSE